MVYWTQKLFFGFKNCIFNSKKDFYTAENQHNNSRNV